MERERREEGKKRWKEGVKENIKWIRYRAEGESRRTWDKEMNKIKIYCIKLKSLKNYFFA